LVIERVLERERAEVEAVGAQLLRGERRRAGDPLAVHSTAIAARADAVLHGFHLHVVPVLQEGAENAAVVAHVAVAVGPAVPDTDGGKVLGLKTRDLPLVHGVVGNAIDPDLAVRPRLLATPLDALGEVLGLARRPQLDVAGRAPAAARIDAHADVTFRHP